MAKMEAKLLVKEGGLLMIMEDLVLPKLEAII